MTFSGVTLERIIERLEQVEDKDRVLRHGWTNPHSYRGFYEDLAFEPKENVTIRHMLNEAKSALGKTFRGWKGGEYEMTERTVCWIAHEGRTSDDLVGPLLLELMLDAEEDE